MDLTLIVLSEDTHWIGQVSYPITALWRLWSRGASPNKLEAVEKRSLACLTMFSNFGLAFKVNSDGKEQLWQNVPSPALSCGTWDNNCVDQELLSSQWGNLAFTRAWGQRNSRGVNDSLLVLIRATSVLLLVDYAIKVDHASPRDASSHLSVNAHLKRRCCFYK